MFEQTTVRGKMLAARDFKPFPVYEDRKAWQDISDELREHLIRRGETYLGYAWPTTLASVFMDYCRNGNRSRYEHIIFELRRTPLRALVLAECCEGKGRFIDDIINGVWVTMEESTWVLPAHNNHADEPGVFPLGDAVHPEKMYIDLFSAECGAQLAWVYYIIGERLGQEAKEIPERMAYEFERRIFTPFLANKGFGWMGYHGNPVNNWNPWIISNILTCMGLACHDDEKRAAIAEKCMECVDFFVKGYAPDGGCDEGPAYWNVAGGSFFDCLVLLDDLTGGKVNYLQDELVRNMCAYIYKMHISGNYFVCYADADAVLKPDAALIYRMGKATGDKNLVKMGAAAFGEQLAKSKAAGFEVIGMNVSDNDANEAIEPGTPIYRGMKKLLLDKQLRRDAGGPYPMVRDNWFEGIQVMTAREEEGTDKGLFLSAKGGNNGESHNHNDIGSFVVFCDGKPAIIDIGRAVYERKTFSPQRYEIPQIQSLYHNLPIIGGEGQLPGTQYAARDVQYASDKNGAHFSLDIAGAYPESLGVESWKRSFDFDRKTAQVTIDDTFALQAPQEISFALITPVRPTFTNDTMTINLGESKLYVRFDPSLEPTVEPFDTGHDAWLSVAWGEHVYRTVFAMGAAQTGSHRFVISKK